MPPKGNFQKNDKKPSEFLLAFTALSIVVRVSKQSPKIVNIFKTVHISKYNDIFNNFGIFQGFVAVPVVSLLTVGYVRSR